MSEVTGVLVVDKPAGFTSHDVVAKLRRITGIRRIGHGGTLDPLATGVLPVLIGRATRLAEYLSPWSKTYRFTMRLGLTTDTYDADGRVVEERDASRIGRNDVEAVLPRFRGEIDQRPPLYSAIKREGRPLYTYARAQEVIEVEPRRVHVYRLDVLSKHGNDVEMRLVCGPGTYARAIAHDIGEALGCGAHLTSLVREAVGPLTLEDALTLPAIEEAAREGDWERFLLSPDVLLSGLPQVILSDADLSAVVNGRPLRLPYVRPEPRADDICRAYDRSGRFVALLRYQGLPPLWKPHKVFVGGTALAGR